MANLKYVKDGRSHELPARGAVSSVNGKTGVVDLDSSDINVDNTAENPVPILNELSSLKETKVDKTTTVNGHALSANVTVTDTDIAHGTETVGAALTRIDNEIGGINSLLGSGVIE